jgi:hypothetical protein
VLRPRSRRVCEPFGALGRIEDINRRGLTILLGALVALGGVVTLTRAEERPMVGSAAELAPPAAAGSKALDDFAHLPLAFVANKGQTDGRVRYFAQGSRYGFFLTPESLVMSLMDRDSAHGVALSLDFVGADPGVAVRATDRAAGQVSYLRGSDPTGWQRGLSTFGEVVYHQLWPGIDLAVRGRDGDLKYEFRASRRDGR